MADEHEGFDSEPEDSWHPDDPVPALLDNIRRRVALLKVTLVGIATQREQLRLEDIDTDLAFILKRIQEGREGSQHG
jgi:hypothetical protein